MGHRTRGLVGVVLSALAVVTACGKGDGGEPGSADPEPIASADEVLKVVDKGFAVYRAGQTTETKVVSYGFVIENVSDEVAVTVRVAAGFTDEAGKPMPDVTGGAEFSVVLPGQRIGAGGSERYDGETIPEGMTVAVTLIAALDTPDGDRHLKAPGPYAELETGTPVAGEEGARQTFTVDVTNAYDVPIRPKATAVVRDAEGNIVGGSIGKVAAQEIQPGAGAPLEFVKDASSPKLAAAKTIECYADPGLGKVIVRNPVWQSGV